MDITDKNTQPTPEELEAYIGNPLFSALCAHMQNTCRALTGMAYSGDRALPGWNMRFCKGGRTLLRLYPRQGYFTVLVVVGRREKERLEAQLSRMGSAFREAYYGTREGMGQRWLLIDLHTADALYADVLELVAIRRQSR